jgi:hypothetical protein
MAAAPCARADELPEYRLKAIFLYNFVVFTEWPAEVGSPLNLCLLGPDPFGTAIDELVDKPIGGRNIVVRRMTGRKSLADCHVLFVAASAITGLRSQLAPLKGRPILTVGDGPDAAREGVAIDMQVRDSKMLFEVNLQTVQEAHLKLSSKLLRLAKEVIQ